MPDRCPPLMQQQLQAKLSAKDVTAGDSLYLYRSEGLPLIGQEWESVFVSLRGTLVHIYGSEKDFDLAYSPREEVAIIGLFVDWEGKVGGKNWALSLIDPAGCTRLRLAALSETVAEKWLTALVSAGCTPRTRTENRTLNSSPSSPHLSRPIGSSISLVGGGSSSKVRRSEGGAYGLSPPPGVHHQRQPSEGKMKHVEGKGKGKDGAVPYRESSGRISPGPGPGLGPIPLPKLSELSSTPSASSPSPSGNAGASPTTRKHSEPMLASTPVHTATRYSYLSSERVWHEKHTGMYNLAMVILVATNARLALENALKYGLRPFRLLPGLTVYNQNILLAACYPMMMIQALFALGHEVLAHRFLRIENTIADGMRKKQRASALIVKRLKWLEMLNEWLIFICTLLNTTATIALPWIIISHTRAEPVAAVILMSLACVAWMKLVSYHHVMWDLRLARRDARRLQLLSDISSLSVNGASQPSSVAESESSMSSHLNTSHTAESQQTPSQSDTAHMNTDQLGQRPGERGALSSQAEWCLLRYPENLTLGNLSYFIAAPTLTYQVSHQINSQYQDDFLSMICDRDVT